MRRLVCLASVTIAFAFIQSGTTAVAGLTAPPPADGRGGGPVRF